MSALQSKPCAHSRISRHVFSLDWVSDIGWLFLRLLLGGRKLPRTDTLTRARVVLLPGRWGALRTFLKLCLLDQLYFQLGTAVLLVLLIFIILIGVSYFGPLRP